MQTCKLLVEDEIEFWHSMIKDHSSEASEQAVERMTLALKLAERKLLMMDSNPLSSIQRQ